MRVPFMLARAEARNAIEERGPIVQLVGEFHKGMAGLERGGRFPEVVMERMLMETPIHSIDLVRALAGSDVAEVHSLVKRGAGVDVTSRGELFRALRAGANPAKIVYSGVGKRDDEIAAIRAFLSAPSPA